MKKIQTLKQLASQFPIPREILDCQNRADTGDDYELRSRELRAFLLNCTVGLDVGYSVTFTFEERPYGLCRHLEVSVGNGIPEREAMQLLLDEFGFQGPLGRCIVWEEKFGKDHLSVNVVEALDPKCEAFKYAVAQHRVPVPA